MNFKKLSSSGYELSTDLWSDSSYIATIQQLTYPSSVKSEFDNNKTKSIIADVFNAEIAPTDTYYNLQRHLSNPSGYDLNVLPAWANFTGRGVRVGVLDQGIDGAHPDLAPNTDFFDAYDATSGLSGAAYGRPLQTYDNHGTAVAGLIGAARNNIGVVGVAYDATLIPLYDPLSYGGIESRIPGAFLYAAENVDVLNNSWGFGNLLQYDRNAVFVDNFSNPAYAAAGQALKYMADEGRDGLGTAVVFAAGNGRNYGDDTNFHNFQNSRYVITVASTNFNGILSTFSTSGSSILVSAFGQVGSVVTTDRLGASGYNTLTGSNAPSDGNYVYNFAGTSAAAPQVAGVVALMLEANPNLGWRDIKHILAYTARWTDQTESDYTYNHATNRNGGGLHISSDLGFGLVDAAGAVRLAEFWSSQNDSHNELAVSSKAAVPIPIPDASLVGVSISLPVEDALSVEQIELHLQVTHPHIGDLSVTLRSPSGTYVTLVSRPGSGAASQDNLDFVFSSPFFWGEEAKGTWTAQIFDTARGNVGSVTSLALTAYGSPSIVDDVYFFTDEYGYDDFGIHRQIVFDQDGINTLNFGAVSSNTIFNMNLDGYIGDKYFFLGDYTRVGNVVGGAGTDRVFGNQLHNSIFGARGDDYLTGDRGHDTVDGGIGADSIYGAVGYDSLIGGEGNDQIYGMIGRDTIFGDGQDYLSPRGGNDYLFGGPDLDVIYGGGGNDTIDGGSGRDYIHGGYGDDLLQSLGGGLFDARLDTLVGGFGNDTIILTRYSWKSAIVSFDDIVLNGRPNGVDIIMGFQSDIIDSSQKRLNVDGTIIYGPSVNLPDILDVSGLLDDLGYARDLGVRQQAIAVQFSGTQRDGFNLFNLFVDTDHNGSAETLIAQIQNVTNLINPAIGTIDVNENFIWL